MSRIASATVYGLGGSDRAVRLTFEGPVTVLWGLNGSGKTSLLRILHAALENSTRNLSRIPFDSAEIEIKADDGRLVRRRISKTDELQHLERLRNRSDLTDEDLLSYEATLEWAWTTSTTAKSKAGAASLRYKHSYLPITRVAEERLAPSRRWTSSGERVPLDEDYFDSLFTRQVSHRWQTYNSAALSKVQQVQQHGIGEILRLLFQGPRASKASPRRQTKVYDNDREVAFSAVKEFLKAQDLPVSITKANFNERYHEDATLREIVGSIQHVMQEVSSALEPQRQLERLIGTLYTGNKKLEFTSEGLSVVVHHRNRATKMPLGSLSSGERQLLQILLETMAAEDNCVIVDEPELSMHVDWQRELIYSMVLVNPAAQIILASHSPEIVASAEAYSQQVVEL